MWINFYLINYQNKYYNKSEEVINTTENIKHFSVNDLILQSVNLWLEKEGTMVINSILQSNINKLMSDNLIIEGIYDELPNRISNIIIENNVYNEKITKMIDTQMIESIVNRIVDQKINKIINILNSTISSI